MSSALLGFHGIAGFDMEFDPALGANGIDDGFWTYFSPENERRNFPVKSPW